MICPECRDVTSFHEHRDKTFTTRLGDVRVSMRPYYRCSHFRPGHGPGDEALGRAGRGVDATGVG